VLTAEGCQSITNFGWWSMTGGTGPTTARKPPRVFLSPLRGFPAGPRRRWRRRWGGCVCPSYESLSAVGATTAERDKFPVKLLPHSTKGLKPLNEGHFH